MAIPNTTDLLLEGVALSDAGRTCMDMALAAFDAFKEAGREADAAVIYATFIDDGHYDAAEGRS